MAPAQMPVDGLRKGKKKGIRMSRSARTLVVAEHCPAELRPRPPPPPPASSDPAAPPPPPPRNGGWCLHDFALHKQLGVGATSVVFQGAHSRTGLCVALKVYFKAQMSALNRHQVQRETEIHCRLDHVNIIAMYGAFEDQDHVVLILEYASKGDLFDMLRHSGGRMREKDVTRHILAPFMTGLAFIHSHSIIHRDIKLENTLFSADGTLKIADFGLSVDTTAEAPVTRLGTLDYMSPEVMRCPDKRSPDENKAMTELAYDNKVDTWACGVLAFELLVGCPPFGMSSRDESIHAILSQPPKIPSWLPADAASFLKAALTKKAARRPTVVDLLGHPWILSFIGPRARSSGGMLGPPLHAPASTSAPGAIATTPDRAHSPHGDPRAMLSGSAALGRGPPPPPPHPRSGTPPLPQSSTHSLPRRHHARSSAAAAHAFAQPSPAAGGDLRGPVMHRGQPAPRAPAPSHGGHALPPGRPDMIPRPASAFAAHTVHAGFPSDSAASAAQPFTYHTVHAALQMWATEEMETPARPVQHAPAHANSNFMQRPQPSLPPPQMMMSRSPSPDLMLQHEQTLDSRMHHLTQLQSMSCAPQHAPQHAAPAQPPSPGPSTTGSAFNSTISSGALRMDVMPSAFLPTSDLSAAHAAPFARPQCSSAGSGGAVQGSPPPSGAMHSYRHSVNLRPHPHPPPPPVRAPSGGAQPMQSTASASLSPRSSASTPMYGTTHTTVASNTSCESPHGAAPWPGAASGTSGRVSSRHLHWSSGPPQYGSQPQPRKPHLSPGALHVHGSAFAAPVSPRRSEELAAACAACVVGLAQLQCGPGGAPQQPLAPPPPPREGPDALYRDWGPPEHTAHRGGTSRQSSKRSDLTVSSAEGSMTAASLCAYEVPPSHRGAASTYTASTYTASPDWVHPILMSTMSMDTTGVESDAGGMMATATTAGMRTHASLSSPRAHRSPPGFPRLSHGCGTAAGPPATLAHAATGTHGGTLNLSAVAAVAGAAARQRIEWEAQADPYGVHSHGGQGGVYRRTSSSGSRRRHVGRPGGDGVRGSHVGGGRGPGQAVRHTDKLQRPGHSEIMPADPPHGRHRGAPHTRPRAPPSPSPVDVPASIMWEGSRR